MGRRCTCEWGGVDAETREPFRLHSDTCPVHDPVERSPKAGEHLRCPVCQSRSLMWQEPVLDYRCLRWHDNGAGLVVAAHYEGAYSDPIGAPSYECSECSSWWPEIFTPDEWS